MTVPVLLLVIVGACAAIALGVTFTLAALVTWLQSPGTRDAFGVNLSASARWLFSRRRAGMKSPGEVAAKIARGLRFKLAVVILHARRIVRRPVLGLLVIRSIVRRAWRRCACWLGGHDYATRRVPVHGWRSTTRYVRVNVRCRHCGAVPPFHAPQGVLVTR